MRACGGARATQREREREGGWVGEWVHAIKISDTERLKAK